MNFGWLAEGKKVRSQSNTFSIHQSIPHCRQVDSILSDLARKFALARFVRVSAEDLEFDLVGSSAILAYRGGILVANLVRLVDYVNDRFDVESVEDVLIR